MKNIRAFQINYILYILYIIITFPVVVAVVAKLESGSVFGVDLGEDVVVVVVDDDDDVRVEEREEPIWGSGSTVLWSFET